MSDISPEFFVSGGTLPLNSESYIERGADLELFERLLDAQYCFVLNSRQMGKSSLCVRTMARLRSEGVKTVFIDLTQLGGHNVQIVQWYAGLTMEVGRSLNLLDEMLEYFEAQSAVSPMQRFFGALREIVIERVAQPVVILIDEIDATRSLPFSTDEFFAGIRECFNRRVLDEKLKRLTFCLLGVAVPKDLIRDPATTPFNIGARIQLRDLSQDEVRRYGPRLGPNGEALASQVHYWTNGQPYLTQSVCQEIVAGRITDKKGVDDLVERLFFRPQAIDINLNLADVANRALNDGGEDASDPQIFRANLLSVYDRVWKGGYLKDDEANRIAVVLKLAGLVRPEGERLVLRNRIYRRVFDRNWTQAHMPGQELLRQKQSFRLGVIRGVAITAILSGVVALLALVALRSREEAVQAEEKLDAALYISNMNGLRLFEDAGDTARMAEILSQFRASRHRGLEWNLWMARLHDSPEEYTLDYSAPGKFETGILSTDGRKICISDNLSSYAVVVDRESKKVTGSYPIPVLNETEIIAEKQSILMINHGPAPVPVIDVESGREVSKVGSPGFFVEELCTPTQSDIVAIQENIRPSESNAMIELWNLRTGKLLYRHKCLKGIVNDAKASRNGTRIIYSEPVPKSANNFSSNRTRRLIVWDTQTDKQINSISIENDTQILTMSESGRLIGYLDALHVAKVMDLDTGKVVYSLDNGEDSPAIVQFAPDDKTIAFITSEGVASLRELPSGRLLATKSDLRDLVPSGRNSGWIESASTVKVIDLSRRGQGIVGNGVRIARDGKGALRFVTEGNRTVERLSDPALEQLKPLAVPLGAYDFTYNGLWGLVSGPGDTSQIVSVDGSQPSVKFPYDLDNFSCATTTKIIVVTKKDRTFAAIDGTTGKEIWSKKFNPSFRGIWVSPDGGHLIGSSFEGKLATIGLMTGEVERLVDAQWLNLSSLNFSRDGHYFLTGGGEGDAVLWDSTTLRRITEFRGTGGREIEGADISPDGKRVVTCNITGAWQIWDRETGKELSEIRASRAPLRSVVFTSDGRNILTSGDDGLVREWAALDKDPTVRIPLPAAVAGRLKGL